MENFLNFLIISGVAGMVIAIGLLIMKIFVLADKEIRKLS